MQQVYNVEVEIQDRIDVEVSVVGNAVTLGAKPVVNTAITPLTDQTPLGANYTIQDSQLLDTGAAVIGTIVAGVDAVAPDATAVVKDQFGATITTEAIPSGTSEDIVVNVGGACDDGTAVLKDTALSVISSTPIPSGSSVDITAPDATAVLKDTALATLSTNLIKSGSSLHITAPDSTVNIQKQDSTPANIGSVIPVTAKSDETLAVNVPVSDSTVNIQRKDTAGGLIGAVIPVAVKAEGTIAQDIEAPDASAVLKDTAGATLSTTAIKSNDSADITAPDGIIRDSTPTDVNVKSNEVLVISDTDVTNSDNATVLYTAPKFSDVVLPSIRLTVGATDHDYETSDFSYAGGVLSKTIDDIAGSTDGVLEASANCYQVQSYLETATYHPFTVNGAATKSMAFWFKYDEARDGVSNINIVGNKIQGTSGFGLFVIHRNVDGNIQCGVRASGSQLLAVVLTTPAITIGAWNSFVITFSSKSASGMKVYLNKTLLAVDTISSDNWTGATPSSSTPWAFKAIYNTYPTALDTTQQDIDAKFADIQMYNGVLSQAQVDEFHDFPLKETPSYQASLAHRYLSKKQFTAGVCAVDEITGSFPFRLTNGSDGFNNTDTP